MKTFLASSPKWLITFTTMRLLAGWGKGGAGVGVERTPSFLINSHAETQRALAVRIVILTNMALRLPDSANAIAARLIPFMMTKSFEGREDRKLAEKLRDELPKIFNWAVTGWKRLEERGRFKLGATAQGIVDELRRTANPTLHFISVACEIDPTAITPKNELYTAYQFWAAEEEIIAASKVTFSRELFNASDFKVEQHRPRQGEPKPGEKEKTQLPCFYGIRLNAEWKDKLATTPSDF